MEHTKNTPYNITTRSSANGVVAASGSQTDEIIKSIGRKSASVPTLQKLIDTQFTNALTQFARSSRSFKVNDYVLARMRGYPPWPARIVNFTKNGQTMKCYFFGSDNNGSVDYRKAIPFEDAYEVIRLIKIRNPNEFVKGVRELEMKIGIPDILSSVRDVEQILS